MSGPSCTAEHAFLGLIDNLFPCITASSLANFPNELLFRIWIHLDSPAAWARTCKHFRRLSQDTFWRAKWLLQRYELYLVIYEAIARRHIFTAELFEYLTRFGAPLSRNLVQLLDVMRNPLSSGEVHVWDYTIRWGTCISFSAFQAVI